MPGAPSTSVFGTTTEYTSFLLSEALLKSMEGFGHDSFLGLAPDPHNRAQPAVRPFQLHPVLFGPSSEATPATFVSRPAHTKGGEA